MTSPSRARLPRHRRAVPGFVRHCALVVLTFACSAAAQDLHAAEQLLLRGQADQAVAQLHVVLSQNPNSGPANLLLCRTYLSTLHGSEAADACDRALKGGLAQDADAQDWAGRAFGMQAEHAGPISGLKLAIKVRNAFQTAYTLNRRNAAAANDLGEYYTNAPALVGGGTDKALALAGELQGSLPEIAHRLRALVAEKGGDPGKAEQEFVAATEVAQSSGALVDLANFYVRQHNLNKATEAARRAVAVNHAIDANVADAATALMDAHQNGLAQQAFRSYLEHGRQSDQAPAFRVHTLLGNLLARTGDTAGARREYTQALQLASGYAPAQKGLSSL